MAGKIIIDTIDTDNAFITLNVQQSLIATMNVSGIYSNTGVKMIGANGTISNTAITGNITSSQITSNPTFYGNVSVTGAIGVGGATPTSNGSGITFPATQSASSDANTLDDYEEGTFTCAVGGGTTNPTTPVTTTGYYTKIGDLVTVTFSFSNYSNIGASGNIQFTGFPFTSLRKATGSGYCGRSSTGLICAEIGSGGATLLPADAGGNSITWASTGTGTYTQFTITYKV